MRFQPDLLQLIYRGSCLLSSCLVSSIHAKQPTR
jgi:hypothetical protein